MADSEAKNVVLPAIVDLDALDTVRDALIDAVDSGAVRVRAGAVERVSTNALLMLVSAAETARRNNFAFQVTEPSTAMLAAIDRLGLTPHFDSLTRG